MAKPRPPSRQKQRDANSLRRDREVREKLRTFREALSKARRSPRDIELLTRHYEDRLRGRP